MKTTLRRILKYTPVVVLGLFVVVWLLGLFCVVGIAVQIPSVCLVSLNCYEPGCVYLYCDVFGSSPTFKYLNVWWGLHSDPWAFETILGRYFISTGFVDEKQLSGFVLSCPIPWLLTVVLPFAIAPLVSSRFRLWHFLAFTALVAVELAYYLRWQ